MGAPDWADVFPIENGDIPAIWCQFTWPGIPRFKTGSNFKGLSGRKRKIGTMPTRGMMPTKKRPWLAGAWKGAFRSRGSLKSLHNGEPRSYPYLSKHILVDNDINFRISHLDKKQFMDVHDNWSQIAFLEVLQLRSPRLPQVLEDLKICDFLLGQVENLVLESLCFFPSFEGDTHPEY